MCFSEVSGKSLLYIIRRIEFGKHNVRLRDKCFWDFRGYVNRLLPVPREFAFNNHANFSQDIACGALKANIWSGPIFPGCSQES